MNNNIIYVKRVNVNLNITNVTTASKKLEFRTNEFVDDIRNTSDDLNHIFSICAKDDFIDPRIIQTLLSGACIELSDNNICRVILDSRALDIMDRIEEAFVQHCVK